jgi:glycosyltransferase involved in cell wall biosynthesis
MSDPHRGPLVSVVVPTFNSANHFRKCAETIRSQVYSNIEVLVVDRRSEDGTAEIAERSGFRLITSDLNRVAAREIGTRSARGEFVLMVDSDQELPVDCIGNVLSDSLSSGKDALTIREESVGEDAWARLLRDADQVEFELGLGLPRWFRKSVIAGFDASPYVDEEHVAGEDRVILAWLEDNGYSVGRSPRGLIFHHDPGMAEFLKKQFHYVKSGTRRGLAGVYVPTMMLATASEANLIAVHRVLRSWSRTLSYAAALIVRTCFQSAGLIASRTKRRPRSGRTASA